MDPSKLVIPGHPECKPVIVNDKVAIFKFQVTECGARVYVSHPACASRKNFDLIIDIREL